MTFRDEANKFERLAIQEVYSIDGVIEEVSPNIGLMIDPSTSHHFLYHYSG